MLNLHPYNLSAEMRKITLSELHYVTVRGHGSNRCKSFNDAALQEEYLKMMMLHQSVLCIFSCHCALYKELIKYRDRCFSLVLAEISMHHTSQLAQNVMNQSDILKISLYVLCASGMEV